MGDLNEIVDGLKKNGGRTILRKKSFSFLKELIQVNAATSRKDLIDL